MVNTITDTLGGGPRTLGILSNAVRERSKIQSISPQQVINTTGETALITGVNFDAELVGETEKKPVNGKLEVVTLRPKKFAAVTLVSSEIDSTQDIAELLGEQAPPQFSVKFDAAVLSGSLGGLNGAQEVTASTWEEVETQVLSIPRASHLVVSSATYGKLRSLARAEKVEWDGTVLGTQIVRMYSVRDFAVFGDFAGSSAWGVTAPANGLVQRHTSGIVEDNGVTYNLITQNMVAYVVEAYYAFAANLADFRKLTISAP